MSPPQCLRYVPQQAPEIFDKLSLALVDYSDEAKLALQYHQSIHHPQG
jgi:hypothetical protein